MGGILLIAVGRENREVMDFLKDRLGEVFGREVFLGRPTPEPDYAFDRERVQYDSTAIINSIMDTVEYSGYERVLGVADLDLYSRGLNFVFGEAGSIAATVALARLNPEFWGHKPDRNLFLKRALTESVHELGHTYGLPHCRSALCVMYFSNTIADTDKKGCGFCTSCRSRLNKMSSTG